MLDGASLGAAAQLAKSLPPERTHPSGAMGSMGSGRNPDPAGQEVNALVVTLPDVKRSAGGFAIPISRR